MKRLFVFAVALMWASTAEAQTVAKRTIIATVNWTCTCTNQTGFNVYRKIAGSTYVKVGSTAATDMSFNDRKGLRPNTTYVYQIGAYNEFGETKGPETIAATSRSKKHRSKA